MKNHINYSSQNNKLILNDELGFLLNKSTIDAAISCYSYIGKGDQHAADNAAVKAMRNRFNKINFRGKIVIGEGERDKAPMLHRGELVGNNTNNSGNIYDLDIAVDPLEGTKILSHGDNNALSVAAFAHKGNMLEAPDIYMEKIAIGFKSSSSKPIIDLDNSTEENINNVAEELGIPISEVGICILDRPRHKELIEEIRKIGARIYLIRDGDIYGIISTNISNDISMYMGIGGAPEGVLAAAALKTLGGEICTRLVYNSAQDRQKAEESGINDLNKKYYLDDLIKGDAIFCATGVTSGNLLSGVKFENDFVTTNSLMLNSYNFSTNYITSKFHIKPQNNNNNG